MYKFQLYKIKSISAGIFTQFPDRFTSFTYFMVWGENKPFRLPGRKAHRSMAHLSNQFKRMTGLTPSDFKNLKNNRRYDLGDV